MMNWCWQLDSNTQISSHSSYDQLGQQISRTDAANRTSQSQYNALGQITADIDALSGKTQYQYDLSDNLSTLTDAKGNQYHFEYDQNNNLLKETKTLGNDVEYSYNAANQLTEQKQANGNRIQYQYDAAGNISQQNYIAAGTDTAEQTVNYQYDANNQLTDVQQSGSTNSHYTYQRDALGRIVEENISYGRISKTLKYSYDTDGNLASITYPDNSTVNYRYANGQLQQAILPNGEEINWRDYQWNQPGRITYPQAEQTNSYDALQRPTQIKLVSKGQTLLERHYSYDKVSNISSIQTEKGSSSYQYDQLDRLTQVKPEQENQAQRAESYSYDAIGNRTGSAQQPGEWQYNDFNQLIKWGEGKQQTSLSYTTINRQLATEENANKKLSYSYNAAERLSKVSNDSGEIASYQYDPFGRRISKTVNGKTTYYIYSSEGLIAELDQTGRMQVAYGWAPDSDWGTRPLWQANLSEGQTLKNASYHYLITDHLGTPQLAINSAGEQSWKITSDAFGNSELDANNQITMNLRFPGQYYDEETGLTYNYFRDYDAKTGRYIQNDPIGLAGGINTYGYVGGNPLIYSDPTGEIAPVVGALVVAGIRLGIIGLRSALSSIRARRLVSGIMPGVGAGINQNIDRRLKEGNNGLPYLNSRHPGEDHLLNVCEGKKELGYDPFDPNDRCQKIRNAIYYLSMRARIRAGDLIKYGGGDSGHNLRYNRVLDALKKLVNEAKLWGCEYDKQADEILKSSKRSIAEKMSVSKEVAKKFN